MTATQRPRSSGSDAASVAAEDMSLFEHLAEVRTRLFRAVVGFVIALVIGFIVHEQVLDLLIRPYCDLPAELRFPASALSDCQLIVTDVLGQFFLVMKISAMVAVVLAGPWVAFQIWRFITPGLRPVERRYAVPFLLISQVLFATGAVFSYLLLPVALEVLLDFAGDNVGALLGANEYLGFLLQMMIGAGIAFEFPLILISLVLMGVVGVEGLTRYRRHALFGAFVASAIITPTTDPVTMIIFAGPLVFFYELSILVARVVRRRRARAAAGT